MSTLEELQRQLQELREREEKTRREAEQLRHEKEEAEAQAQEERARAEEERARAEEERARAREEKARVEEEKARAEERAREEKARADALERHRAPTGFLDYVRNVQQHLFAAFSIEPDPRKMSSISTTPVEGKFYPQHFQPWREFDAIHRAVFDRFVTAFAESRCFPALTVLETIGQDLSPKVTNELALYPFIRAAIEKPAAMVVSKYLDMTSHERFRAVKFHGSSYGRLEGKGVLDRPSESAASEPPAQKKRSPVKNMGVPDRWLFAWGYDEWTEPLLVGEIKPAHVLSGAKINRVLAVGAPPRDDFFPRAAKQDGLYLSGKVPGEVYVAKALCQTFHYMITSGLEFGYLASGDGLILLRVTEEDPNTLYYFASTFPVGQGAGAATAVRDPRDTALACLATLCMLSLESTRRPARWIDARDNDLKRWPKSGITVPSLADTPLPLLPPGRGNGGGGGGSGAGTSGGAGAGSSAGAGAGEPRAGTQSVLKRPRSPGASTSSSGATQRGHSTGPLVVELPTLPYCTQKCLASLCRGLPRDAECPNAGLHQAAAAAAAAQGRDGGGHALTASQVRSSVVAQLATNMDKDCQSFLFNGHFGRYGVLFKITVTGFGYTFVAKAVQAEHRYVLEHEALVYAALEGLQGRLIPVCLGLIDLERPIPLQNCQWVSHMLLLSYVGLDTSSQNVPSDVDLDLEMERTRRELYLAGLSNDDVHRANIAWSEETRRIMEFDFDEAYVEIPPSPQSLPFTKRDLHTYQDGQWGDNVGQAEKRLRMRVGVD